MKDHPDKRPPEISSSPIFFYFHCFSAIVHNAKWIQDTIYIEIYIIYKVKEQCF